MLFDTMLMFVLTKVKLAALFPAVIFGGCQVRRKHFTSEIRKNIVFFTKIKNAKWFIVSYDSANKQKHHKSHRMQ